MMMTHSGSGTDRSTIDTEALCGSTSSASSAAREALGRTVRSMLALRAAAGPHLEASLRADPNLVPAQVLRGFGLRKLGRRDQSPQIVAILTQIKPTDPPREVALVGALEAWLADDGPRAADLLDAQLERDPRDLLVMKLAHGVRFVLGDSTGMRASVERVVNAHSAQDEAYGLLLGSHSFALEETGSYAEAERAGRRAVELEPLDVCGAHSVAHVMFMMQRHEEGATWLRAYSPNLDGCGNLRGHVDWHEALVLVELGRHDEALERYDREVVRHLDADYRDVSNAVSLLFRLERRGVDVGDRWERYADFAQTRLGDHGSAFADLHYALALCGAGRMEHAARFVASMTRTAASAPAGFDVTVQREVGVPLASAVLDLFGGNSSAVAATFDTIASDVQRIGGSHAQRALVGWLRTAAHTEADRTSPPSR